jgi:hypothetical protein
MVVGQLALVERRGDHRVEIRHIAHTATPVSNTARRNATVAST